MMAVIPVGGLDPQEARCASVRKGGLDLREATRPSIRKGGVDPGGPASFHTKGRTHAILAQEMEDTMRRTRGHWDHRHSDYSRIIRVPEKERIRMAE